MLHPCLWWFYTNSIIVQYINKKLGVILSTENTFQIFCYWKCYVDIFLKYNILVLLWFWDFKSQESLLESSGRNFDYRLLLQKTCEAVTFSLAVLFLKVLFCPLFSYNLSLLSKFTSHSCSLSYKAFSTISSIPT